MFRGTHVSPAQAFSEKGNNSKCFKSKSIMTSSGVLPLILVCLYVKFNVSTCETSGRSYHQHLFLSNAQHKKKLKRGITPKILMPELWALCITFPLIKVYPNMKFHFYSISRTGVIVQIRKGDKGK